MCFNFFCPNRKKKDKQDKGQQPRINIYTRFCKQMLLLLLFFFAFCCFPSLPSPLLVYNLSFKKKKSVTLYYAVFIHNNHKMTKCKKNKKDNKHFVFPMAKEKKFFIIITEKYLFIKRRKVVVVKN